MYGMVPRFFAQGPHVKVMGAWEIVYDLLFTGGGVRCMGGYVNGTRVILFLSLFHASLLGGSTRSDIKFQCI